MEPFKNIYNKKSMSIFAHNIKAAYPAFNKNQFLKLLFPSLLKLEMKDRVRSIAKAINDSIELSYRETIDILLLSLSPLNDHTHEKWEQKSPTGINSFMVWPLTQYVETYGIEDLKYSMYALREMTKRFTSEFSIRAFLIKYDQKVFPYLIKWKKDKNQHVRRLVSEGTRPNLPWGLKVENINANLERNITLISSLRDDDSEYVRRSVANHLNDISRLDEKLYFKAIKIFKPKTPEVEKIIRHSARSLLKAAHPKILKYYGYNTPDKVELKSSLDKKIVIEGDHLELKIHIKNTGARKLKVLIDYELFYLKNNGSHAPKVFRYRDTQIAANESLSFKKKIDFKKVTTRKHYTGVHFIAIKINGKLFKKIKFKVEVPS